MTMEKGKRSKGIKGNSCPGNEERTPGTKRSSCRRNERLTTSLETTKKRDKQEDKRDNIHF